MSETMLTTNGRTRKSLAEQIDRLDGILDGLADGLQQAVATAVQEAVGVAVREAVQAVLTEVATNPDLLVRLGVQPTAQPTPDADEPEEPTRGSGRRPRLTERLGRVAGWVKRRIRATWQAGVTLARQARQVLSLAWSFVTEPLRRFKGRVMLTLAVAAGIALTAYLAGPWLAAGAGFLGSVAVVATDWLREAAHRLRTAWLRLQPHC
jgi:hypothetical protein